MVDTLKRVWLRGRHNDWIRHNSDSLMTYRRLSAATGEYTDTGVRTLNVYLSADDGWWSSIQDSPYAESTLHVRTGLTEDQWPLVYHDTLAASFPWAGFAKGVLRPRPRSEVSTYSTSDVDEVLGARHSSTAYVKYNSANVSLGGGWAGAQGSSTDVPSPQLPLPLLASTSVATGGYSGTRAWLQESETTGLIDFRRGWTSRGDGTVFRKAVFTFDVTVMINVDRSTANSFYYRALERTRWVFYLIEYPILSESFIDGSVRRWSHPSFGILDRPPTFARPFFTGARPPMSRYGTGQYTRTINVSVTDASPEIAYSDALAVGVFIKDAPLLDDRAHQSSTNVIPTVPGLTYYNGVVGLRSLRVHYATPGSAAPDLL